MRKLLLFFFAFIISFAYAATVVLPEDRLAFALQLTGRGLHTDALNEYLVLKGNKQVPQDEVLFRLGETYRLLGRTQEAEKCYSELLVSLPQSQYADTSRLSRAMLTKGSSRLNDLKALDHDGVSPKIRATVLYYLGENAESVKDEKSAMDYYSRVVTIGGTNRVANLALFRQCAIWSKSKNPMDRKMALGTYLNLASSKDPRIAEEALFFAGMISYGERRWRDSAMLFRRLSAKFEGSKRITQARPFAAWSEYLSGNYSEALTLAVFLRDDGDEDGSYLVAASLRMLNRLSDSIEAYDFALTKYPNGKYANREWFEKLLIFASMKNNAEVLKLLATKVSPGDDIKDRAWSIGCEAAIAVTNMTLAIEYAKRVSNMEKSPLAPNATHRLAWLYENQGDFKSSSATYRMMAEKWPENKMAPQALFLAGVNETKANNSAQARANWTRLLERYPDSPFASDALFFRAMEEVKKKEFRLASSSLRELIKRFPDTPKKSEAYYWIGMSSKMIDDIPEAEKNFREALKYSPTPEFTREIKLELAFILKSRGQDVEAANIFAELMETKAVDRLTPARLAWTSEALLSVSNFTSALKAAEILEKRNSDPTWNQIGAYLAGCSEFSMGHKDAAVAAWERSLATGARTSSGAMAALRLGQTQIGLGKFSEAHKNLSDAVSRADSSELIGLRVKAYASLAENEETRGDADAALKYHLVVGTLFDDPELVPKSMLAAAQIMRAQGKIDEANKLLEEMKTRYPNANKGEGK
jgi:TolA-binding protein